MKLERRGRFVAPLSVTTQRLVDNCRSKLLDYLSEQGMRIEVGKVRVKSVIFYTSCPDSHVIVAVAELLGAVRDVEVKYQGSREVVSCLEFDLDLMLAEGARRAEA